MRFLYSEWTDRSLRDYLVHNSLGHPYDLLPRTTVAMLTRGPKGIEIHDRIERGKREIIEDMKAGRVPTNVWKFAQLHDYVDANEYAGLCEDGAHPYTDAIQSGLDAALRGDALDQATRWAWGDR